MRSIHGGSLELLQTALAELDGVDASQQPDRQVRLEVATLLAAVNTLMAVVSSRVGVFDARGLSEEDGFRTTRSWLQAFGRMSQGAAAGWLARSRLLRQLPALAAGSGRGDVSAEHLARVSALVGRVGVAETVPFDEILADLAAQTGPVETQKACERIAAHLDPDGAEPDPARDLERREFTCSRTGSMVYLKGRLDAEGGAALMTAMDAFMRPPGPDDLRTAAQRRADALVELARGWLISGGLPTVGGVRPQLGILVTPEALLGTAASRTGPGAAGGMESEADERPGTGGSGAGGGPGAWDPLTAAGIPARPEPPWLQWAGEVPPELAQRIACDADIWRVVLHPATGLPLDVGRTHRIVPYWIRKALHARDRHCRWPGCDIPPAWTDAHHLTPWYLGGQTNVDELVSLCRWHHGLVHEGRWKLRLDPYTGEVRVTRPDGRPYELEPDQPHRGARPHEHSHRPDPGRPADEGGSHARAV